MQQAGGFARSLRGVAALAGLPGAEWGFATLLCSARAPAVHRASALAPPVNPACSSVTTRISAPRGERAAKAPSLATRGGARGEPKHRPLSSGAPDPHSLVSHPHSSPLPPPPSSHTQRRSVAAAAAARPLWRPGSTPPAHLNGSLPGDYGFDPLNLGADPDALRWYQQAELQNGRWAMMGAAGILGENLLGASGLGGPAAKVPWYEAGAYTYFAPASSLFIAQLFLFGWVEARRYQDYRAPGSASQDPIFTNNKLPAGEVGYPGGIFDPLNFAKGNLAELKVKEVKNARLAMLGCLGFFAQAQTTGKQPLANLADHLKDPWAINVLSVEHARAL